MSLLKLKSELTGLANPKKAKVLKRFFKTGKGEYGEGDIFLGISVPKQRKIAKKYRCQLTFSDLDKLIKSKIHEHRLVALLILIFKYQCGNILIQEKIFKFYFKNAKFINNWDLVDCSAYKIVGAHLYNTHPYNLKFVRMSFENVFTKLAKSQNLWERRIAIISTFYFIKKRRGDETFRIVKILLGDCHDLIHKACGWMLREVGKKCGERHLTNFLNKFATQMPRTMLRYSIERLPKKLKLYYLNL